MLSDDELRRLYVEDGLTLREIGEMFGVSRQRVHQRMRKAGIKRKKKVIKLNRRDLLRLYVREGLTQREVGQQLGVSGSSVSKEMRRHGISPRRGAKRIEKDHLYKLYVTDGLFQREIAAKLGCTIPFVTDELRRHRIKFRHSPGPRRNPAVTYDKLYRLYVERRISTAEIGSAIGVSSDSVRHWLKKFRIERRPGSPRPKAVDKDSLRKLYLEKKLSMSKIAAKLGVSRWLVEDRLRRFKIA
jgi:DNA-binding transcriptional regulator LsrR (DeoR family)